jgi:hypothetical protein
MTIRKDSHVRSEKKRKLVESDEEWSLDTPETKSKMKSLPAATPHPRTRHVLTTQTIRPLRASLLKWYEYEHAKRGMPWRRSFHEPLPIDPVERSQIAYRVWISEIMCQQTQVATVIPYYNRWMAKYASLSLVHQQKVEE